MPRLPMPASPLLVMEKPTQASEAQPDSPQHHVQESSHTHISTPILLSQKMLVGCGLGHEHNKEEATGRRESQLTRETRPLA